MESRPHATRREKEPFMSSVFRFLPGLIAAAIAFVALRLVALLKLQSLSLELLIFLLVYIVVAVLADQAMRSYGRPKG
jgi:membrane protein implicated in regulation of membrane protease activity